MRRGRNYQKVKVVAGQFEKSNGELCCVAPFCYTENTVSTLFEEWFKTKLFKAIVKGSTLIMDKASFHRKKKLKNLARRYGMRLLFLPAYSPDFNPIEKTWANMKRALIDILPDVDRLQDGIYKYFKIPIY